MDSALSLPISRLDFCEKQLLNTHKCNPLLTENLVLRARVKLFRIHGFDITTYPGQLLPLPRDRVPFPLPVDDLREGAHANLTAVDLTGLQDHSCQEYLRQTYAQNQNDNSHACHEVLLPDPRSVHPTVGNRDAVPGGKVSVGQRGEEQFEPLAFPMP